jgi:hypothetical protein
MLEWIVGKFLAAPVIGAILQPVISGLLTAQKQKLDAQGSHEAVAADLAKRAFDLDQREAEVNASIIIAEQGNVVTRSVRPMFALPFIVFLWKVVIWDKVLGLGTTDPLDPKMWGVFMLVVGAYMGGRTAERVADKIAGVFKK